MRNATREDLERFMGETVRGLVVDTASLVTLASQPDTAPIVARDYGIIADAHQQLGRVLAKLAMKQVA